MQIELRNFRFNEALSEETNCFSADIYINGKKAGFAKNLGHGGNTDYYSYRGEEKLLKEAEEWSKQQPPYMAVNDFILQMDMELYIDMLVDKLIKEREEKKRLKKMQTHIMWGVPGGSSYTQVSLKKEGGVAGLLQDSTRKSLLKAWLKGWKKKFKEGEQFLNTNLPEDILP